MSASPSTLHIEPISTKPENDIQLNQIDETTTKNDNVRLEEDLTLPIGTDSHNTDLPTEPLPESRARKWRRYIFNVLKFLSGPIVAFPFFFDILQPGHPEVSTCAAVTIWMGFWWLLEPVPMACTCLLPTVLFPMTGLLSATTVGSAYFGDLTLLFMGSYIMAIALEKWELHKRFALIVLRGVGTRPKLILLGFMGLSWFISQWLSNSATAAMLLPMAVAILHSVQNQDQPLTEESHPMLTMDPFAKALLLGTAYASSIGGYATLTGTGTNLMLAAQMQTLFPKSQGVLTYLTWYLFSMPMSVIMLGILYLYFVLILIRKYDFPAKIQQPIEITIHQEGNTISSTTDTHENTEVQEENDMRARLQENLTRNSISDMFKEQYKRMGPWRSEDTAISILFVSMALLWITRELPVEDEFIGWPVLLFYGRNPRLHSYVSDGTVAMVITTLLFIIPSRNTGGRLMNWQTVHDKMPWAIVLLLGAGFALSKAFAESKFADFVASTVGKFGGELHPFILLAILCITVSILTEFTSNITTNSILLPVLATLALTPAIHQNPLFFMVPATIACSLAFMTPIGTPPNALAYAYGYLTIWDMVKTGAFLNGVGVIVVIIWTASLGGPIFGIHLNEIPDWAMNTTSVKH